MDPITHGLVGGAFAKSIKAHRKRFWIFTFLGNAPDLDVIFSVLGQRAYWLQHRGISHSIFGVVLQALLYARLFRHWDHHDKFLKRAALYSVPMFLHIFCDWLTSYGVPLLSPFDLREFAGNIATAVTVVPFLFMAIALWRLHRNRHEGWGATAPIWTAWVLYLVFCLSSRTYAGHLLGQESERATLVAGIANPCRWTAVIEDKPYNYNTYSINVLLRSVRKTKRLETPIEDPAVQASLCAPNANWAATLLRWPVARVFPGENGGKNVEWGKVIFSSRGVIKGRVRVHVSSENAVVSEEKIYGFWSPDEQS